MNIVSRLNKIEDRFGIKKKRKRTIIIYGYSEDNIDEASEEFKRIYKGDDLTIIKIVGHKENVDSPNDKIRVWGDIDKEIGFHNSTILNRF